MDGAPTVIKGILVPLNVCGDWYDVVDLSNGRFAVAVGDVVGHGLQAAAVMGTLRSTLSAAIRAVPNPAQALEILGLYARSFEDALAATGPAPSRRQLRVSAPGHRPAVGRPPRTPPPPPG